MNIRKRQPKCEQLKQCSATSGAETDINIIQHEVVGVGVVQVVDVLAGVEGGGRLGCQ